MVAANYTVSDGFGGLYILWYDIYGTFPGETPGNFHRHMLVNYQGLGEKPFWKPNVYYVTLELLIQMGPFITMDKMAMMITADAVYTHSKPSNKI